MNAHLVDGRLIDCHVRCVLRNHHIGPCSTISDVDRESDVIPASIHTETTLGPWALTSWDMGGRSHHAIARPEDILTVAFWTCSEHVSASDGKAVLRSETGGYERFYQEALLKRCCHRAIEGLDANGNVARLDRAFNADSVDPVLKRVSSKLAPVSVKGRNGITGRITTTSYRDRPIGPATVPSWLIPLLSAMAGRHFKRRSVDVVLAGNRDYPAVAYKRPSSDITYSAPADAIRQTKVKVSYRKGSAKTAIVETRIRPAVPVSREDHSNIAFLAVNGGMFNASAIDARTVIAETPIVPLVDEKALRSKRETITLDRDGFIPVDRMKGGRPMGEGRTQPLTKAQESKLGRQRAKVSTTVFGERFGNLSADNKRACDLLILAG